MAKQRRSAEGIPSNLVDRAAEAAAGAGDVAANMVLQTMNTAASAIAPVSSSVADRMRPRKAGTKGSPRNTAGTTIRKVVKTAARENRKTARAEASAAKKVGAKASRAGRKVAKAATKGSKKRGGAKKR